MHLIVMYLCLVHLALIDLGSFKVQMHRQIVHVLLFLSVSQVDE